jgi:hypothetical protein
VIVRVVVITPQVRFICYFVGYGKRQVRPSDGPRSAIAIALALYPEK